MGEWLERTDAARALACSVATIIRMESRGRLATDRDPRGRVLVRRRDVMREQTRRHPRAVTSDQTDEGRAWAWFSTGGNALSAVTELQIAPDIARAAWSTWLRASGAVVLGPEELATLAAHGWAVASPGDVLRLLVHLSERLRMARAARGPSDARPVAAPPAPPGRSDPPLPGPGERLARPQSAAPTAESSTRRKRSPRPTRHRQA